MNLSCQLIGEENSRVGVLPCPAVPAVQNPHDDDLECDLLVNNIVAEEPGPLSSDSGRVAEVVEQCQRGPRRLRLQFTGSQATQQVGTRPFSSSHPQHQPHTLQWKPMVVNSSDHHEASPNVHSERGASEWDSGEEHVSEPGSVEAVAEEADEDIDVQFPRPAALRSAFLLVDDWNLTDKLKQRASVMKSVATV